MRRLATLLAVALGAAVFLFTPAVAAADGAGDTVAGLEVALLAFAPVVVFLTSVLLGPDAGDAVKRLVPAAVTVIVAGVYFVGQSLPGLSAELAVSVVLLGALSNRVFEWLNAASHLAFGRSLNEATGSGLIGRGV